MKAAELFVRCLEEEGVQYVFGVPGEENADLAMALQDSDINFVLTRHEQGAAFMADVYGRLTGEPGVCLGTLGPGATNLVTGVADANLDRAPIIAITGQADIQRQHKEGHQFMDVVGMFEPITKWTTPIIHPANIPEVVRKAFKLAKAEKPGACHIELPEDIARAEVSGYRPITPQRPRRPVPDDKVIGQAWDMIRQAKRPVILAGNGTIRKRASQQLRRFCDATGIGVMTTFMGKGAVARDAPYSLFTVGLQARDLIWRAMHDSDLVITLGYDLIEYHPQMWNPHGDKPIVHMDFLPAEVDEHYGVGVEVVGDLAHALWMLTERAERDNVSVDTAFYEKTHRLMQEDIAEHADDDSQSALKPQKVLWDVREAMGPRDILLSDVGAHKMWIARYYHCDEPNTCIISNGFASMGIALPGAVGAKLAHPDSNVLAICGDGGFLMNVQDLETARRLNLPIVVMIWEDGGYGLIKWKQDNTFGRHTDLDFGNPDFVALAEAFDCIGVRVERSADLPDVLKTAFAADRPTVITLPIDYRENKKLTGRLGNIESTL
jgi:acetolactate synthase-1/2/3 large subunit